MILLFSFLVRFWRSLGPLVCDLHEGMYHGRKWKKFSGILQCGNMTSSTGNMMFLQAASHDTDSELLLSLSSLQSCPQDRTLSILVFPPNPRSTSFHANAWLVTSFPPPTPHPIPWRVCCAALSLEETLRTFSPPFLKSLQ